MRLLTRDRDIVVGKKSRNEEPKRRAERRTYKSELRKQPTSLSRASRRNRPIRDARETKSRAPYTDTEVSFINFERHFAGKVRVMFWWP